MKKIEEHSITEKVFGEYYLQYEHLIKKLAYKTKLNGYTPEDLIQELSMVLLKCIENFKESNNTKFFTYFYASSNYHLVRLRKINKDVPAQIEELDNIKNLWDSNNYDEDNILLKFLPNSFSNYILPEDRINKMLNILGDTKMKDYIKLKYIYDMPIKTIAKNDNVSKQYVSFVIKKGLDKIREAFEDDRE
jgi:RNA polymerase sigma factor (sigma-70 family)